MSLTLWALAATTARASDSYEPNDSAANAWGPVAGGFEYAGVTDTVNDEDWFKFYSLGAQQLTFRVTWTDCGFGDEHTQMEVRDSLLATTLVMKPGVTTEDVGDVEKRWTTPYGGGDFFVVFRPVYPRQGCSYRWSVSPASALSNSSVAQAKRRCDAARNRLNQLQRSYRRAKRLKEARRPHKSLSVLRMRIRDARTAVTRACA